MEAALIFGFMAYFGQELAEYTHNVYDKIVLCIETNCLEDENNKPTGKIIIKDETGRIILEQEIEEQQ